MSELITDEIVEVTDVAMATICNAREDKHAHDGYECTCPDDEMIRAALEAAAPLIAGQALEGITEVFQIVDRHTNRRLEVSMYLTSNEAFAVVATWPADSQKIARVQSVAVAHG